MGEGGGRCGPVWCLTVVHGVGMPKLSGGERRMRRAVELERN
jgi:hypothetical protein